MSQISKEQISKEQTHDECMQKSCALSEISVKRGGGPFGAVIVNKETGEIIGKGHNMVTLKKDPTLHAEMVAISDACHTLNTHDLSGCSLYTSCEPCPMCLSAIYWARIDTVYFGNTKEDAARIGFDDSFIYDEIGKTMEERKIKMERMGSEMAAVAFEQWLSKDDKVRY
jgi:tRNA(Arg) A34 adenosine deaminase TadA